MYQNTTNQNATSQNMVKVAVIIPVYNRATVWKLAVDSVMAQSLLPKHLVIVNDGSTDATAENIRKWIGDDGRPDQAPGNNTDICIGSRSGVTITLINQEHSNAATARNRGLSSIKNCDYVLFLDSDDEIPPDFIERTSTMLNASPQIVAVSTPRLTLFDSHSVFDDMVAMATSPVRWMLYYGASILSCTLFRLGALPQNYFDSSLVIGEDMLIAAQVATQGEWSVAPGAPTKFARKNTMPKMNKENEARSVSLENDPKESSHAAMAAIRARNLAFRVVRDNRRFSRPVSPRYMDLKHSYMHGILRDFYRLAFGSGSGLAKYGYGCQILYHMLMRWLTWLIRQ